MTIPFDTVSYRFVSLEGNRARSIDRAIPRAAQGPPKFRRNRMTDLRTLRVAGPPTPTPTRPSPGECSLLHPMRLLFRAHVCFT